MRYLLIFLYLLSSVLFAPGIGKVHAEDKAALTPAKINGESAILIDAVTGQILFEKNSHLQLYPASITKIATGIYAIENGNPDDIVTVSKNARYVEGTRVYLGEGEQVTLRKLEYGLLMHSGNDAATAIAEHLSGTTEQFAQDLNAYLKEKVGITETHFTNPHGLHDPNHYTTAYEMAKIAQYAMKNPEFREIVGTNRLPWDGREWKSELINHNKLLRDYEGATGIKNGFTDQALHTLVGSAKRGDTELIAVTMKTASSSLAYKDVSRLLDYGFAHFETKPIAAKGQAFSLPYAASANGQVEFIAPADLFMTVPLGTEPETELLPDGKLVGNAGEMRQEFQLNRVKPLAVSAAVDKLESDGGSDTDLRIARYLLLFAWFMLNVLLVLYTLARAKKRKNMQARQWRRRVG